MSGRNRSNLKTSRTGAKAHSFISPLPLPYNSKLQLYYFVVEEKEKLWGEKVVSFEDTASLIWLYIGIKEVRITFKAI